VRTVEQRQAWLQRQGVMVSSFEVLRRSKPSPPLKSSHGLLHFDAITLVNRGLQRQGLLHQHHLFADGMVTLVNSIR
jgi:hypothetical protein